MGHHTPADEPLVSAFIDDAEMSELVELFVEEMSERVATLERLWSEGEMNELKTIAHQLKGSSGGYGFPTITEAAATLENSLKNGTAPASDLRASFDELLTLCKRVSN